MPGRFFFQDPCDSDQALSNLRRRPGGKSEDQSRRKFRLDAEERQRTNLHPELRADTEEERKIFLRATPGESVQTCVSDLEGKAVTEQFIELLDEHVAPLGINFPHPSDVTEIKAFRDETSEGGLIDRRGVLVHGGAELRDRIG